MLSHLLFLNRTSRTRVISRTALVLGRSLRLMSSSSADATAAAAQPGFKTLFTNNSQIENYAKARPTYPPAVLNFLANNLAALAAAPSLSEFEFVSSTVAPAAATDSSSDNADSANAAPELGLAVDIACGSGQLTAMLTQPPVNAKHVFGFDPSKTQIDHAPQSDSTTYAVGEVDSTPALVSTFLASLPDATATALGFPAAASAAEQGDLKLGRQGRVGLVTVAQAFHWFEFPRAFAEIATVLKGDGAQKPGMLAIVGYDDPTLDDSDEATKLVNVWFSRTALHGYWSPRRELVNDRYDAIFAAVDHEKWIARRFLQAEPSWASTHRCGAAALSDPRTTVMPLEADFAIKRRMPVSAFLTYLGSWSAYSTWQARNGAAAARGEIADPMDTVREGLVRIYGSLETEIAVSYPVMTVLAVPRV